MIRYLKYLVKTYKIDKRKFHIMTSYAVRDFIKLENDLDIAMDRKEWDKLPNRHKGKYNGQDRFFYKSSWGEVEIFAKDLNIGFPNNKFAHNKLKLAKDKNGFLHYSYDTYLDWKNTMHRDKDKKQLEKLLKTDFPLQTKLKKILAKW